MAVFKFADDVLGWAADWKGVHAVVDQLVHVSFRDMVPAGRMSAERGSTEERILENRKAFRKPLRPLKVAWRLSIVGVFWGYTSFGYSSLARDSTGGGGCSLVRPPVLASLREGDADSFCSFCCCLTALSLSSLLAASALTLS